MKILSGHTTVSSVRYAIALLLAATLAWEYLRDSNSVSSFAVWILLFHFVYFQLPLRSRASAYFHSISFVGAFTVPILYIYLLCYRPNMEEENMETWNITWDAALLRTFLMHFAPIFCHILDISINSESIMQQYRLKPRRLMYIWPLVSFHILTFIHEFSFPEPEEANSLNGVAREQYFQFNSMVSLLCLICAYGALYQLIMKPAFIGENSSASASATQQQQDNEDSGANSDDEDSSSSPVVHTSSQRRSQRRTEVQFTDVSSTADESNNG